MDERHSRCTLHFGIPSKHSRILLTLAAETLDPGRGIRMRTSSELGAEANK